MNSTPDVSTETEIEQKPLKNKRKTKYLLITIAFLLVFAIVAVSFSWIGFLNKNPFAEIGIAAAKTLKKSAKADISVGISEFSEETVSSAFEIAFVNSDGKLEISSLGSNGEMQFRNSDYSFVSESDGSISITKNDFGADEVISAVKKSEIQRAVELINEKVFKKEVLNPEETEKRVKRIADYYGKRDFLEENLGFSVKKENGEKIFSFRFGAADIISIVCNIVYNSEKAFNEQEVYEKVVSVLKIASNLDIDSEVSLDIGLKKGYVSTISLEIKTFSNGTQRKTSSYLLEFSGYSKTEHDKAVLDEFNKAKETLGDFKRYERTPDGSSVFTDEDDKKHYFIGDAATVCVSEIEKGKFYA